MFFYLTDRVCPIHLRYRKNKERAFLEEYVRASASGVSPQGSGYLDLAPIGLIVSVIFRTCNLSRKVDFTQHKSIKPVLRCPTFAGKAQEAAATDHVETQPIDLQNASVPPEPVGLTSPEHSAEAKRSAYQKQDAEEPQKAEKPQAELEKKDEFTESEEARMCELIHIIKVRSDPVS